MIQTLIMKLYASGTFNLQIYLNRTLRLLYRVTFTLEILFKYFPQKKEEKYRKTLCQHYKFSPSLKYKSKRLIIRISYTIFLLKSIKSRVECIQYISSSKTTEHQLIPHMCYIVYKHNMHGLVDVTISLPSRIFFLYQLTNKN